MSVSRVLRLHLLGLWSNYIDLLAAKPLLTKCATGVVGTFLGDAIAQFADHRQSAAALAEARRQQGGRTYRHPATRTLTYDVWRAARLCFWAAFFGTPLGHYWFLFLDRSIMPAAPTSPLAVALKLLLDQLLMAPLGMSLFFLGIKCLEGRPALAWADWRAKIGPGLTANYMLWPLVNLVNFRFVPSEQRILFVSCFGVLWAALLSHIQAGRPTDPKTRDLTPLGVELKAEA
mmetsp:Transcript_25440/g.55236  ORF Transcript_25440/g.55236 Transcript_25440/m.55236 type:complete len:232 (+) Transcript_25440:122-817(+)